MLAREKEVNTKSQYQKQFRIDSTGDHVCGKGGRGILVLFIYKAFCTH